MKYQWYWGTFGYINNIYVWSWNPTTFFPGKLTFYLRKICFRFVYWYVIKFRKYFFPGKRLKYQFWNSFFQIQDRITSGHQCRGTAMVPTVWEWVQRRACHPTWRLVLSRGATTGCLPHLVINKDPTCRLLKWYCPCSSGLCVS